MPQRAPGQRQWHFKAPAPAEEGGRHFCPEKTFEKLFLAQKTTTQLKTAVAAEVQQSFANSQKCSSTFLALF
jgi:hypothetical protein